MESSISSKGRLNSLESRLKLFENYIKIVNVSEVSKDHKGLLVIIRDHYLGIIRGTIRDHKGTQRIINPIWYQGFRTIFCIKVISAANGPIFKIFFCLKDFDK